MEGRNRAYQSVAAEQPAPDLPEADVAEGELPAIWVPPGLHAKGAADELMAEAETDQSDVRVRVQVTEVLNHPEGPRRVSRSVMFCYEKYMLGHILNGQKVKRDLLTASGNQDTINLVLSG